MKRLSAYLEEAYLEESKNTHMEHLEDAILNMGVEGAKQAIDYLRYVRDMLGGNTKAPVNVTVKWDGAPAIFAGIDPNDGKFFVAKKGIFNKNPKIYKTDEDIDEDVGDKPSLANKMKLALKHLPAVGIKGVVQGDFLYSKEDIRTVDIDGEPHITFHPNTIVYAIPKKSELASRILASEFGVVWHTTYSGSDFESMSASFGKEIAGRFTKTKAVWSVDATFSDVSGSATMTKKETEDFTKILSNAGRIFSRLDRKVVDGISDDPDLLLRVKAFINSKIKEGQRIRNTKSFVRDLVFHIEGHYQKQIDAKKTEKGKQTWRDKKTKALAYFVNVPQAEIIKLFDFYNLIVDAKQVLVKKLDKAKQINTLLLTPKGYEPTGQEGFVAIDHQGKNALKIVDRLQFSHANFSPDIVKGWQK